MRFKQKKGFTLVELLIAVFILSGAISGVLLLYTTSIVSSQQAWDTTVATSHGEHVLEEMLARDTLDSVLAVNWEGWVVGQRLNTLPDEVIKVTFADPDSDPLEVEVRIDWLRKSRIHNVTLNSKITK
jgi:prepilin-type N-terminal cleavage/methylation domain-containing protein